MSPIIIICIFIIKKKFFILTKLFLRSKFSNLVFRNQAFSIFVFSILEFHFVNKLLNISQKFRFFYKIMFLRKHDFKILERWAVNQKVKIFIGLTLIDIISFVELFLKSFDYLLFLLFFNL